MGWAISWLAVKGKSAEGLVQELGLAPTGKTADYGESMFTGRRLPGDWFLLVINRCDHDHVRPKSLAVLSRGCEIVACSLEEHVMVCSAESWRDGAQVWRIEHDAQQGIDHIGTSGLLPDGYAAIEREFAAQQEQAGGRQADTDYFFEIPLQAAKAIVGFKHDEAGIDDEGFEVFKRASPSSAADTNHGKHHGKRPWWKVW
jgi:hypothetical protein